MGEITKKAILEYLSTSIASREKRLESAFNFGWEYMVNSIQPELETLRAIRSLIEDQPKVKRSDMEAIIENVKTTNTENMDGLLDYLEAKGITIEKEDWEKEVEK